MELVSFKGFPRPFITAGEVEVMRDAIRVVKGRIMEDIGEGIGRGQVMYFEGTMCRIRSLRLTSMSE